MVDALIFDPSGARVRRNHLAGSILRHLAQSVDEWAILKNHDQLPEISGDVDLCVGRRHWDLVTAAIARHAGGLGQHLIISCDHFLGVRLQFVVPLGGGPSEVLEIDLADGLFWKGVSLLSAESALAAATLNPNGYPVVDRGIEAAVLLTAYAIQRSGSIDPTVVISKGIAWKAKAGEPEFVRAMTAMHGQVGKRAAQAFLGGTWQARQGLELAMYRSLRSSRHPTRKAAAFLRRKAARHFRGVPRDLGGSIDAWLDRVRPGHELIVVGS